MLDGHHNRPGILLFNNITVGAYNVFIVCHNIFGEYRVGGRTGRAPGPGGGV